MLPTRQGSLRIALLAALTIAWIATTEATAQGTTPSRKFFALPTELDVDRGAANGDAGILRIVPVYSFPVGENWKLVNITALTLADAPSGTPVFPGDPGGDNNTGFSDLLHMSILTPPSESDFIWGAGVVVSAPTATASGLGSDKWAAGPAFRVVYRSGPWNIGMVGGQRWSFAGSGNRPDVNQLLIRGAIRRQLSDDWYFVSAPIIVANWDAPGEKWLVPVGGGIGRRTTIGGFPWGISLQGYYNAIRADGAPDWVVRLSVIAAIPFGD